ncbi:TolC family protein [Microvirga sp. c23x22]|uniref:TolC family protein n=2 Tax=Microvirga terricola TaxID=2719797 RepID=A0ABX0VG91_9HYPH|nr:TolC family protein [Microvirga terricola]NIX78259.1 TolC family protein [Microvirga terricola]
MAHRRFLLAGAAFLPLALAGCATFSPDNGLSLARGITQQELGKGVVKTTTEVDAAAAQARAEALLKKPLTPDSAVQIALLQNRGLQAAFNDLGVSEAVYVEATLPPRPTFALSRLAGGLELEVERQILIGLFELATLPGRAAIAEQRFRAAQFRTAEAVLRLAAETRRQYYRTIAANQQVAFLEQALASAEAMSQLAQQLGESGALNKLEQAREHAFYVELGAQLARARIEQKVARERLTRQLGVWGREIDFRLPNALPSLPASLVSAKDIERRALETRVDLRALRADLNAVAGQYGLTGATRFISDIELAGLQKYDRKTFIDAAEGKVEREKLNRRGLEIAFQIPIYDFGEIGVRNAEETYMAAANRVAERAVNVRSEAREAYLRYRGHYDLAQHYQSRVLPLRQAIQDESLLQYSGMLADVSQLIIDARARILSNLDAINARRDFWIAATDLKAALVGGGAGGSDGDGSTTVAAAAGGSAGGH